MRNNLRAQGRTDVELSQFKTWEEVETRMSQFFDDYIREMHPCKDDCGNALYPFVIENLHLPHCAKPQTFNLCEELETVCSENSPDLTRLKDILLALIENGQRHTHHGEGPPVLKKHPCARKSKKTEDRPSVVYCRYLFPRELWQKMLGKLGTIRMDPYRNDLRNLFLERNDTLLNNFEAHMLLINLGNIDWRALLNLWAVLDYLTKYAGKAGEGSVHLGVLFDEVLKKLNQFEQEDGISDLWRRTIMKFYSKIIGDRDYSLLEVMHFGLRLPPILSNFGDVENASVSNATVVKTGRALQFLKNSDRVTYLSKLEKFNERIGYPRAAGVCAEDLENLSFYAFWRLFDVRAGRLFRRRTERIIGVTGLGWPSQAAVTNEHHES